LGDVLVRSQVTKFKKLKFHTQENIGYGDISLPAEEMQTRACVFTFPEESPAGKYLAGCSPEEAASALRGLGSVLRRIAPVYLLCEARDLGLAERARDPHFGCAALYVYDKYPGGTGLAEALAEKARVILAACLDAVEHCPCRDGCPSCVGPGGNKKGVIALLKA
jgi:DEAD/DEAH box helicase domain-containing protein